MSIAAAISILFPLAGLQGLVQLGEQRYEGLDAPDRAQGRLQRLRANSRAALLERRVRYVLPGECVYLALHATYNVAFIPLSVLPSRLAVLRHHTENHVSVGLCEASRHSCFSHACMGVHFCGYTIL
jgi:hypothetical protein